MISEKDYNGVYLKGYEYGKNDNNSLKIHYEIKPSFTTRKLKELQQENEQLKAELQEANDNIIWWSNRFKAVQRDYENLKERIDKTIELTKNLLKTEYRGYYQIIFKEILKSLGDKE